MADWSSFETAAPRIAAVFRRRHRAAGNLCLLATNRADGFPRISPMEPRFLDGRLWLFGMPGTAKFADLAADPRCALHTATVDPQVGDGDAKVWGTVSDVRDAAVHDRLTQALFEESGFDVRGRPVEPCLRLDVVGAAAVEIAEGHLDVTVWREGEPERVVRKH